MANPQKENGHIDIANEIAEALARTELSSYESKILWVIFRQTYGWHKKADVITLKFFKNKTGMYKSHIVRTITKLVLREIITRSGKKYSFQKNYDRWREPIGNFITRSGNIYFITRSGKTFTRSGNVVTHTGKNEWLKLRAGKRKRTPKETSSKETSSKETSSKETYSLFEFWNSLKIVQHKNIKKFEGALKSALRDYKSDKIKKAMKNYATVLRGEEYFWTYKWTLKEFLQRGLDKFLDINNPLENFLKQKGGKQINKASKEDWRNLKKARIELERLASEERIYKWLKILPENLHGKLAMYLRRIYPTGKNYGIAKARWDREKGRK